MAWDDIFEPAFYKCWTEALNKEEKIRRKWYSDYESKKQKALAGEKEADYEELIENGCTCGMYQTSDKGSKIVWPRTGALGTTTIIRVLDQPAQMKSQPQDVRNTLYEGISREGKGRYLYLKKRSRKDPEERYYDPVCTSMTHGWNHGKDNELSCTQSDKCNIQKDAFV
ncbi:protein ATP6V1FNB-like [Uloborus diversus]|uniref:protein ATP6V1FNB-like n=1 Tax=Uloborus diversus TaxID=327109 RepID=UPI00240938C0|nr:protein ATP6V1FNB-like [Uloborus diversus]